MFPHLPNTKALNCYRPAPNSLQWSSGLPARSGPRVEGKPGAAPETPPRFDHPPRSRDCAATRTFSTDPQRGATSGRWRWRGAMSS